MLTLLNQQTHTIFTIILTIKREIIHCLFFTIWPYMATPHHRNPCPRGHEIYNFGRGFLAHHYYIFSLSAICTGVKKKIFKEIQQFYTFYPKITSPLGGGSWNLQFFVSLPYRWYISNLVKIGPVVLEKKMLTNDDGRQPIAIGHLSDSGDLKKIDNNNNKISQRRKEFIWQKYITDLWTEVYYNTKSNVDVYILVKNFENFKYITIWEPIIHLPNLLFISSQRLTYATFMLFLIYQ